MPTKSSVMYSANKFSSVLDCALFVANYLNKANLIFTSHIFPGGDVMVGEAFAGLGAFKAMFDMAKGLKDINDAAIRNRAVIDLQEQILAAQSQQATLIERVSNLEKENARFETWETEKKKYELKDLYSKNYAYVIKEDARGSEPTHWICASCYEQHKKSILQRGGTDIVVCPECKTRVQFQNTPPPVARRSTYRSSWMDH